MIGGCMVNPTLIEDMLCRLPEIRYSAVVVDWDEARRIAQFDQINFPKLVCASSLFKGIDDEVAKFISDSCFRSGYKANDPQMPN